MSVTLTPSGQLGFQRPLTQLVKRSLAVTNTNSSPVAFKVKTTAPKQYCVRPNSGRIEPGDTVQVQVLLQPMKEDPAPGTKCRDKFLVQSVIITPEHERHALTELWSTIEKEDKARAGQAPAQIHEQKIRCTYLPPAEESSPQPAANGSTFSIPEEEPSKIEATRSASSTGAPAEVEPAFESTIAAPASPSPEPATPTTVSTPAAASPIAEAATTVSDKAVEVATAAGGAIAGAASAVGLGSVAKSISTPSETVTSSTKSVDSSASAAVEKQLAEAKAEIANLRQQLSQSESTAATLRSRAINAEKVPVSSGGSVPGTAQAVVEQKVVEGVPIQIVAGIVVGVFLVTYVFL